MKSVMSIAEILTNGEREQLEQLIDRRTMSSVLGAIADIAYEKAEHIRTNWQDNLTAKRWERDGNKVGKVSVNVSN